MNKISIARITSLIFMVAFSSLFTASFFFPIFDAFDGGRMSLKSPLALTCLIWSGLGVAAFTLLSGSPLGDKIASLFLPFRKASLREEQKIKPALERLQQQYREKFGKDIEVNVQVMDMPHINGLALGQETIALSTGLLKTATDDQITAILAHEIGHLHHRDGILNLALIAASLPTWFLSGLFKFVVTNAPRLWPKLDDITWAMGAVIFTLGIFLFVTFLICWIVSIPVLWLVRSVEFFTEWPIEYRADKFAVELGHGPAMVELFESIEDEDVRNSTGFLSKYLYTHPPTALRIDRIERMLMSEGQVEQVPQVAEAA